ncbi:DNA repair protein RadA [bacterium]|nr:DNA repair protein RadA [bacterium]MCI0604625.1 DNA repair protein RadA [bacterium]
MKGKKSTQFVCQECGGVSAKWLGKCPDCGNWNSLVEESVVARETSTWTGLSQNQAVVLTSDQEVPEQPRTPTGIPELDRVLGGGIVDGSLILIGGDPGIGKSTIMLQLAHKLSEQGKKVLYVSGEESENQIRLRANRLNVNGENIFLYTETCMERILSEAEKISPFAIIVDSIQTAYTLKLPAIPGSVGQIRETAMQFLSYAKQNNVPVFLTGHVTKEGLIAGPRMLEHLVDTVLYFEGDNKQFFRIVRAVKNRFGSINEIGVFEMSAQGLLPVKNPSQMFLSERPASSPGSVVMSCMEGTRPFLVELQALVTDSTYGVARRTSIGLDNTRVTMLVAVLEKRIGYYLGGQDIFLNVVGGLSVEDPAADLAICAAIVSSLRNKTVDPHTVLCGEVGLTGEIRSINHFALRASEAQNLGFQKIVAPLSSKADGANIEIIGCETVRDALSFLGSKS